MWMARTGSQWRHLPDEYGKWNSVFRRYRRWVETGVFGALLETLTEMAGRERSADMIDSTIVPGAPLRCRHKKGTQAIEALGRSRGGFTTKLHACCDGKGRPLGFVLTPGEAHDVKGFGPLFRMIADKAKALLADRGHDADAIREEIAFHGVQAVIPAKRGRRIATRYDKTRESYLGFVTIASATLWLRFVHEA